MLFAQLSPAEIADVINSHNRKRAQDEQEYLQQTRDRIAIMDVAMYVLLHNLASMLPGNDNLNYMRLRDAFPDLFPAGEGESPAGADGKLTPEMQRYKAQRINHAYQHNAQRAGKG